MQGSLVNRLLITDRWGVTMMAQNIGLMEVPYLNLDLGILQESPRALSVTQPHFYEAKVECPPVVNRGVLSILPFLHRLRVFRPSLVLVARGSFSLRLESPFLAACGEGSVAMQRCVWSASPSILSEHRLPRFQCTAEQLAEAVCLGKRLKHLISLD